MFRVSPRGRLKVVAVVSVRLVNTPATLRNRGGWFCFWNKLMMDMNNILTFCQIGPCGPVSGPRMFADRNQEAESSRQSVRLRFPKSAGPGPFKARLAGMDGRSITRSHPGIGGSQPVHRRGPAQPPNISQTLPYPKKHDDPHPMPPRCPVASQFVAILCQGAGETKARQKAPLVGIACGRALHGECGGGKRVWCFDIPPV